MIFEHILGQDLTSNRPEGGHITAIEIIQREDSKWYIRINVSWHPDKTFIVAKYNDYEIKLYRLAMNAMRHAINEYGYEGAMIVRPKPGKLHKLHI